MCGSGLLCEVESDVVNRGVGGNMVLGGWWLGEDEDVM